jgi:hypothetical protein
MVGTIVGHSRKGIAIKMEMQFGKAMQSLQERAFGEVAGKADIAGKCAFFH